MIWAISAGQPDLAARVQAVLDAGVHRVLLREAALAPALVAIAAAHPDRVVLHSGVHGALGLAASLGCGVHLAGREDLHAWRAALPGPLGRSCHAVEEARASLAQGCDWVFLSPVFAPISKPADARPPLGLGALALGGRGAVALGGITLDRVHACRAAGAGGVATLSHLLADPDPAAAARAWTAAWEGSG